MSTQSTGYVVFLRGTPLGRELVTVNRDQSAITITAQGRMLAPLNITTRHAEFKYRPDWTPTAFTLDATVDGRQLQLNTTFADGRAATEGITPAQPVSAAHTVAPRTLIHADGIFASYIALSRRLVEDSEEGAEFRVYVVPQAEITVRVKAIHRERMQIGTTVLDVRRFELIYVNPSGELTTNLTAGDDGGLVRVNIPAQSLDIVREDVASSTSRTQIYSNPGDEAVIIPAAGFNLGATLTRPKSGAGTACSGRSCCLQGRASATATAWFRAYRCWRSWRARSPMPACWRSATTSEATGRAAADRSPPPSPTSPRTCAPSSGGSRSGRTSIRSALRSSATAKARGSDCWPPRARGGSPRSCRSRARRPQAPSSCSSSSAMPSTRSKLPAEEREKRIALQQQIHSAVLTGKGWDTVPPQLRKEADTPWFQSVLAFDPAKVIDDVRQPMLFVHGAIDRQVPVEHVERLSDLARKESKSKSVEVVVVRGVNHLLVPAVSGEVSEYGTLTDRNVSKDVTMTVSDWLKKTFASIR